MKRIEVPPRPNLGEAARTALQSYANDIGIEALECELDDSASDLWHQTEKFGRTRVPRAASRQFIADYREIVRNKAERDRIAATRKSDLRVTLIAASLALAVSLLTALISFSLERLFPV